MDSPIKVGHVRQASSRNFADWLKAGPSEQLAIASRFRGVDDPLAVGHFPLCRAMSPEVGDGLESSR